MTSQINYSAIITTFPVAGKDNDSQGFRDNFASTSAGLSVANTEITALQTNTVKVADLVTNAAVVNDMLGSTISNGLYKQFNGVFYNAGTLNGTQSININNGPAQRITLSGNSILNFTNWPLAGQYGVIRVMIIGDQQGSWTVNFTTENSGILKPASGFTIPLTVTSNNKYTIVEAFTFDHGTNVFLTKIGDF